VNSRNRASAGNSSGPASDPGNYHQAEITNVYPLTGTDKLYQIQIVDPRARQDFAFKAGQFVMLELPGIGEAPFSISSSPLRRGDLELCIRAVGNLTRFLDRVERGVKVGISGPYGSHFPVEEMAGSEVIFVAGGLGLVPLRSPLSIVLANRSRYGRVDLVYGNRTPAELLFTYQYQEWRQFDVELGIIVDHPDDAWTGPVGLITTQLARHLAGRSLSENSYAIVCGPPVMFKYVCDLLTGAGLPMQRMFVSLERRMHCGCGKCCRCNIGSTYVCLSGPVFDYWSVMNLKEAI
jgi:sulfhydrogenase subunit gamma (sulfur reductase)